MKKFIIICLLCSCYLINISIASNNNDIYKGKQREYLNKASPTEVIKKLFDYGFKNEDYREVERIFVVPDEIKNLYPNNQDNQREAIFALGSCLRNQKVNGTNKYSEKDVNIITTFALRKLGLE